MTRPARATRTREREAPRVLEQLGRRLRALRRSRELTVQELSDRSGLSRRFLTDLEAGKGNISIGRLHELAAALEVPAAALLLPDGDAAGADGAALAEAWALLTGLTREELGEVAAFVRDRFAGRAGRPSKIALVGLRGAGKTTIGRRLAERLQVPFVELDRLIEQESGMSLDDLFVLQGEAAYRRLERDVLARVLERAGAAVIATGGGLVTNPEAYELLRRRCQVVWLKARPEDHMKRVIAQGDQRPMRNNPAAMDDLRALLATREPLYALAHVKVDTAALGVERSVAAVAKRLPAR